MFRTRLVSGIALVAIALGVFLTGGALLAVVLFGVSVIAYQELTAACKVRGEKPEPGAPVIVGLVMTLVYYALIGLALGAAASYSVAKEVPLVRVVFCDADAYDIGYVTPEDIAGRVRVEGRGGTVLQPAVDLLERAEDFPKNAPVLIITDGEIEDDLYVHREHAFLIPEGKFLPFRARGRVFRFK